jgi:hypothetical protein
MDRSTSQGTSKLLTNTINEKRQGQTLPYRFQRKHSLTDVLIWDLWLLELQENKFLIFHEATIKKLIKVD